MALKWTAVAVLLAALVIAVTCEKSKKIKRKRCKLAVSDIRVTLKNGETYTHKCDVYTCVKGKLQSDVHTCKFKLGYKQENLCQKWSEDGCCCVEIGCRDIHGVLHEEGAWYQTHKSRDPTRPNCGRHCQCKAGRKLCRLHKNCQDKPKRIERAANPLKIRHMKVLFIHEQ